MQLNVEINMNILFERESFVIIKAVLYLSNQCSPLTADEPWVNCK